MPQLERRPVLTLAVVAVTAVTSAVAVASPTVLAHLERTPAGLHGQWWRTFTSLFMQDSAAGAASNLFFMLVLGVVAEQVASRYFWLACYFGAGIVGELVAYSWQPVGAGNSVAVCGLAGLIALACWRRDARLPALELLRCWCGARCCCLPGPGPPLWTCAPVTLALPRFGGLTVATALMRAWLPW